MNSYSPAFETTLNWFVLIDDQYHGPLSAEDIEHRLLNGSLSSQTLAWSDGLSDWTALHDTQKFARVTRDLPVLPIQPWTFELGREIDFVEADALLEKLPSMLAHVSASEEKSEVTPKSTPDTKPAANFTTVDTNTVTPDLLESVPVEPLYRHSEPLPEIEKPMTSNVAAWSKFLDGKGIAHPGVFRRFDRHQVRLRRWSIGAGVFAACTVVFFVSRLPIFAPFHKTLNLPEDMAISDMRDLNAAAADHGDLPAVALAMSRSDKVAPTFYVGNNLKDGTHLEIRIEGRADTLVDRLYVVTRATIATKAGLAKTPALRDEQGQPYPKGEYHVTILCSSCGTTALEQSKVVAQKDFFIGGERDREYDQRLQIFHQKLREQAVDEITEIKQVESTLSAQLAETNDEFERNRLLLHAAELTNGETRNARIQQVRKSWSEFDARWKHLEDPMSALFQRWTGDALASAFVYGNVYAGLKKVGTLMEKLHGEQTNFVAKGQRDAAGEAKVEATLTTTQAALREIQKKVALVANVPTTANGMPQRPD